MAIAHAVIEYTDEDGQLVRYGRGADAPEDVPGYDELVDSGAISDEDYDPAVESPAVDAPEEIEIDGVRYVKAADGATNEGAANV